MKPQTTVAAILEEVEIRASPERVFAAWTDPEQLAAWWGDGQTYLLTGWQGDLRVGGQWTCHGKRADGKDFSIHGEYLRVEPPSYLSFTWIPSWSDGPATVIELEFLPIDSGTLLMLKHSGFATGAMRDSHQGWPRMLGWIKRYIELK